MCELKETVYIGQEWFYFIILVSLLPPISFVFSRLLESNVRYSVRIVLD